ncbi:phage portal protein [Vagococcus penaei]|uniref:phage portal protein n=1 Tax=Vagococcus penaei TaxID=633807 RepID=UPI000F88B5A8|nr:phage portal protein [Vagococcus penaei]RSU01418.1 phage portal protein [Vagococcus penaei]
MSSKIITSSKTVIPMKKSEVTANKKRMLTYKMTGGEQVRRDLTLLSPPYDLATLRSIGETSTILNQCVEAYSQNIVGFGMGVRFKVEEKDVTTEMDSEKSALETLLVNLSLDRPAKEVLSEAIRHVEECGNAFIEVIRNGLGEVVGIENVLPECIQVTKLNRVNMPDGTIRKFRYFNFQDTVDDSAMVHKSIWYKSFEDPTPLKIDGNVAKDGEGNATELIHLKIGDEHKPYGVPRYIGTLLGILGDRKANELNYRYFTEGRHTPLAIILENAQLTEESEATLKEYSDSIGGESSQHKFILLEAEKVGMENDFLQDNDKDKAAIRLEKLADILQQDALFLDYSEKVRSDVLSAFRLPPVYVGLSEDYNRATVETAKELTEEQVFQPRRDGYEWRLNRLFNDYEFRYVEVFLKSPDFSNTDDIKNILTPAIQARAVAPNDLRPIVSRVLNVPLEPFEGDEYNLPIKSQQNSYGLGIGHSSIDLEKAYGEKQDSELAGMLRRAIRRERDG